MTPMFKTRYSIFYSLLFVSIAFGSNLIKTEPYNLQIAESDDPREILKKTLSASQHVKSYRIRIEVPSVSKAVTIMEYAFPDSARIFRENEEKIRVGKNFYHKKGDGTWEKYHEIINDVSVTNLPATALEDLIKSLAKAEDVKFIGQETVDGVPTLAYQHIMWTDTGTYPMKTWIGLADGLVRRWEFECTVSILTLTKSPVVHTYYDYNADIKIGPPREYVSLPESSLQRVHLKRDELALAGLPTGIPDRYPIPCPDSGLGLGPGDGRSYNMGGGVPRLGTGTNPNEPSTNVDSEPMLLNRPQPNYTEEARKNKIQGTVRVRIKVGTDGRVNRGSIVRGLPDGLDERALQAAHRMQFKPAMKDGRPVAFWLIVEIEFNLRNDRIR